MTFNYKATYQKCLYEFKNEVNLNELGSPMAQEIIETFFNKFYYFLKNIFEKDEFFKTPPSHITNYFFENFLKKDDF